MANEKQEEQVALEEAKTESVKEPTVKAEPEEKPKKKETKAKSKAEKVPVKLLSKHPDEEGFYRVRHVGNTKGVRRMFKIHKDNYPFTYETQFLSLDDLEEVSL